MKKIWNQPLEIKAMLISLSATILGFLGTIFLFWFQRYDVPLAILYGGAIVVITWLILYVIKKDNKNHVKLDIVIIYLRLTIIVFSAILFTILQIYAHIVIISPIYLIISYLVISLLTLLAYLKEKNV